MVDLMSPQSSCLSKPKPFTCQVSTSVVAFHILGKEKIPFCRGTNSLFSHCNEKDIPGQCSRVDRLPQMVKKKISADWRPLLSSGKTPRKLLSLAWTLDTVNNALHGHCPLLELLVWILNPLALPILLQYLDVRGVEISQRCQSHWKTFSTVGDPKALQDGGRYPNFFTQTLKNRK